MYESSYLRDFSIDGGTGQILYSTDTGETWQTLHDFGHPVIWLALDPNDANTMYTSVIHSQLGGIFVSNDIQNGPSSNWTKLSDPPRTEGHPFNIHVLNDGTLVSTYSGRIDAGGVFTNSSGVFVSTNGGSSWMDRSDPGMLYWTKDIVTDPYDASQNTWYVCVFSGWGGPPNGLGGLYRTTDRGVSWTKINDLDRVASVTINPTNSNRMFVTTEADGLWYTDNLSETTPQFFLVSTYPFQHPLRVFFSPYNPDDIWLTSFGNGIRVGNNSDVSIEDDIVNKNDQVIPMRSHLSQNHPNPFNPSTVIEFTIPQRTHVEVSVYNLRGQRVANLIDKKMSRGSFRTIWNGRDESGLPVTSGIYYYRLKTDDYIETRKMVLLK
jgi:hypothetical protein